MTTIEHLKAARALIEKGWCQGEIATTATGNPTQEFYDDAANYCAAGALYRAGGDDLYFDVPDVINSLSRIAGKRLPDWNDDPDRTQSDVLALFDKAIEMEERKV